MESAQRLRNERRASILMTRHYLGGVSDWLKQIVSQSEALLGSDTSSLWNFCIRFSDAISWGNQWWRR